LKVVGDSMAHAVFGILEKRQMLVQPASFEVEHLGARWDPE